MTKQFIKLVGWVSTCIYAGILLLFMVTIPAFALRSDDAGPVRYKGTSGTDAAGERVLMVHDVGNVRMTLSNWGEQGNPDQTPGFFGFEFPLGAETDFLFSSGIWIGAKVSNVPLVSTGTDGDNGTNEFAPTIDNYVATSKQYSELAGNSYFLFSCNLFLFLLFLFLLFG